MRLAYRSRQSVGIGLEVGAENMNIYNNTIMSQWPTAGYGFSDSAAPSHRRRVHAG